MKKSIIIIVVAFSLVICSTGLKAQNLPKGFVLGMHDPQITLNEGVSPEYYESFVKNQVIPAYEKNFEGTRCYLLKSKRGHCKDCYAFVMVFSSDTHRAKFWKPDDTYTELGQKAIDNMKTVLDEWNKLGTFQDRYNDWVIQ